MEGGTGRERGRGGEVMGAGREMGKREREGEGKRGSEAKGGRERGDGGREGGRGALNSNLAVSIWLWSTTRLDRHRLKGENVAKSQDNLCDIFSEPPITELGKLRVCSLKRPKALHG